MDMKIFQHIEAKYLNLYFGEVDMNKEKVLGIIGGMGPSATADLFMKIIKHTNVKTEEEHLRILIDNNPKLPNRQNAIMYGTESPLPMLIEMAQGLERAGADFLILGANTPHYYFDNIVEAINIPMLHIIDEAIKYIIKYKNNTKSIGIMATNAAIKTALFQKSIEKFGLVSVIPEEQFQEILHNAIFQYKVDSDIVKFKEKATEVLSHIKEKGVDAIILGCTELPIVLQETEGTTPIIDPNEIIAKRVVEYAKENEKMN